MSRQSDLDNHANQLNPNNDAYWESRGLDERPDGWNEREEPAIRGAEDRETKGGKAESARSK